MFRTSVSLAVLVIFAVPAFGQPPQQTRPRQFQPGRFGQARPNQRPDRFPDTLKQGDMAPDFTLKSPDGKTTVTLSDYRGKKPVALVFGSYT